MPVRIGIIGHFTLVREALKSLLSDHPDFTVIQEVGCNMKAVGAAEKWNADVLILDLMQDKSIGQSIVNELKKRIPGAKILVISTSSHGAYILELFRKGASGFCLNSDRSAEVISALRNVLAGRYFLSARALDQFIRAVLAERKTLFFNRSNPVLTVRENEVLKLISEGYRTKDIADLLCLSKRTIEKHRYNMMKKLNIHRTPDLVLYEMEKKGEK